MTRFLLAAAAAFALSFAPAALADCAHCKDCPMHKVAQADDKGAKGGKDAKPEAKTACPCGGPEAKGECKCKEGCHCPHCHAKHEKQEKKS